MSNESTNKSMLRRTHGVDVYRNRTAHSVLADALDQFAKLVGDDAPPVMVCWSAQAVEADHVVAFQSSPERLRGVFEARAFSGRAELRWCHKSGGVGDAVVVSEAPFDGSERLPVAARIEGVSYLVLGSVRDYDQHRGVSLLRADRIGELAIPGEFARDSRVHLGCVEYIGRGVDGNAEIIAERITGFKGEERTEDD